MVTRRGFLAGAGVIAGGSALMACAPGAEADKGEGKASISTASNLATQTVAFDGVHQAGIATPQQANLNLVAFTVRPGVDRAGITRLMRLWTEDARALCAGQTPLGSLEPEMAVSPRISPSPVVLVPDSLILPVLLISDPNGSIRFRPLTGTSWMTAGVRRTWYCRCVAMIP